MDVNQKELAAILGITARRIRQLREEYGLFEHGLAAGEKVKRYRLEKCVPEYINYRLEAEVTRGTTVVKEKEQAEHEQIKKKISILKLRRLRRELHEAEDVEEFLTDMLVRFRARLLTVPQNIAPAVMGVDDVNKVIDILEKEMFAALDELSEYDPLKIDKDEAERIIRETDEDEETDEDMDDEEICEKSRKKDIRYIFLGIVMAVPILLIVLPLLSSADEGFQRILQNSGVYIQEHFLYNLARMILALPVAAYLFGSIYGGIHKRNTDNIDKESLRETSRAVRIVPNTAITTAMLIVCAIYLLFIGLQGKYLFSAFAGIRPENFTYAEYARRGFFELCQTAALNLVLLLGANTFSRKGKEGSAVLRWLNVLLSVLTLLLILTAMSKMVLYIAAFGFTIKRVLTMVFMIWMAVVFTLAIVHQWKKFPVVRICVITGAVLYCTLCILPVEHMMDAYNQKYSPKQTAEEIIY